MNPQALAGWLAFTLYISAARADASAGQLFEMRRVVTPAIEGLKRRDVTPEETRRLLAIVLTRVQTIMGKDWRPQGEWMSAIDQLLGEAGVRSDHLGRVSELPRSPRHALRAEAARKRARARSGRHALPEDGR